MNNQGAAGLAGFNPQTVVAFLDAHCAMVPTESGRKIKVLNGYRIDPDDARVMRRWRNQTKAVSLKGLARMLNAYGLGSVLGFTHWAKRKRLTISP